MEKIFSFQFQFHKGTIKTHERCVDDKSTYINFNSIKVQLKQILLTMIHCIIPFQFHKGTIKTSTYPINTTLLLKFQFHKGTIKTHLNTD